MALYASILALSLMSCFLGFALQITRSNIGHVKAGRLPNASAALFPNIPLVPLTYLLSAWMLDRLIPGIAPGLLVFYALSAICVRAYQLDRAKAELRKLHTA
jgi:hypothetical protein